MRVSVLLVIGIAFAPSAASARFLDRYVFFPSLNDTRVPFIVEYDYPVPYETQLMNDRNNGETIHMVGKMKDHANRFDVYLHKGPNKKDYAPLHFVFAFGDVNKLLFNTMKDGQSTNVASIKNPFKAGEKYFDLRIRIVNNTYQVFANRVEVAQFDIHGSLKGVKHLSLLGDLSVVRHIDNDHSGWYTGHDVQQLDHAGTGARFDITGIAIGDIFNVSLTRPNGEYALLLSLNIDESVLTLNEMTDNAWGEEERLVNMPINKGEFFDLTIMNFASAFHIFVNCQLFTRWPHRAIADKLATIEMNGSGVELYEYMETTPEGLRRLSLGPDHY